MGEARDLLCEFEYRDGVEVGVATGYSASKSERLSPRGREGGKRRLRFGVEGR